MVKPLTVTTAAPKSIVQVPPKEPSKKFEAPPQRMGPRITNKEMNERRAKGLCFWCEEKYAPGHNCTKKKVYLIQMPNDEDERSQEESVEQEISQDIQLSLHAMWDLEGAQTMRMRGTCQQKRLRVLIDTGSTHNFLSANVAYKLECTLHKVASAPVEVANGQKLLCTHICRDFQWEMQEEAFVTEVHVIPLDSYDFVLGVQWLSTLGDISWNFCTLQMKFQKEGKQ